MISIKRSPDSSAFQRAQLEQLIRLITPVAFGFALVSEVAAALFRDVYMGFTGAFIFLFGCLVLVARALVRRGRWQSAVNTICAGILGTTLAVALVQPDWFPTLVITSLLTVMVALPYTEDRVLLPLLVGAWMVALVVAVVSRLIPYSSELPYVVQSLFLVGSLAATVATLLLLLWQFRSRLTRTLAQTRAAEERYALAARATNDGLWDWDLTTDEVYFSPRWKEMLGYGEGEVGTGSSEWFDRIHPDDRAGVEERLRAHLNGDKGNFATEYRALHRDGEYLWMLARGVAVWDEEGKAVRIAGSQSNINERKRAEEELKKRAAQLASYNDELEQFAFSVSHDLRAPLRWITGFSKILIEDQAEKLDAESKDYLYRILEASDSMGERVDSLLEISRLTRRKLHREPVDLGLMAQGIADDLRKSHPESNVEFIIAEGLSADVDEQLMRVAIENLLDNAWKFTRDQSSPRIEFGAVDEEDERVYFVKDNGVGFDETYSENLFGPFQRLHTDEEFEGTGLGLATVQRIIHRHGGRVWAEGEIGKGAAFFFTL
ncbi:MAG TPA: PAS domain-containing protein [Rubrobacteraceae bacterium]|nr:PAS domain-containing protein [Rubrobacteraceae bacterium]